MFKKKLLHSIAYGIFLVFAFCGCASNTNERKIVDAEKVILYNEDQTTVLENKTEIEKFVDLLQVDSWEFINRDLNGGRDLILVAELYKNKEIIGKIKFFDENVIQFEIGTVAFNLEAKNDVSEMVLDTFVID